MSNNQFTKVLLRVKILSITMINFYLKKNFILYLENNGPLHDIVTCSQFLLAFPTFFSS